MAENRGKHFEAIVKRDLSKVCDVLRLYDTTNGYVNICNPCDFIAYKYPNMYLIECKSCHGASLPLSNITNNQYNELLIHDDVKGEVAGYLIWFIDKDRTIFIRAKYLEAFIRDTKRKSIPYDIGDDFSTENFDIVHIPGSKKKVFYEYNMKELVNHEWN